MPEGWTLGHYAEPDLPCQVHDIRHHSTTSGFSSCSQAVIEVWPHVISLNIDGDRISDAKIQVLGCPGAVASGCALVSLAKGNTLQEARDINLDELYRELEKMPNQKVHCARLAIKTLQKTLDQYQEQQADMAESGLK